MILIAMNFGILHLAKGAQEASTGKMVVTTQSDGAFETQADSITGR
jgi:hypothetical protein